MNTKKPPFDDLKVRQAVNYAVDRQAMTELGGGSLMTQLSCQLLIPGFPGYRPYCPYTKGPKDGSYHGPDLAKAKEVFTALLGVPPSADGEYYVGYDVAGQHIGLVPGGGPQAMTSSR